MSGSVLLDTNIVIGLFAKDEAVLAHLIPSRPSVLAKHRVGRIVLRCLQVSASRANTRRIDELAAASAVKVCDAATAFHYGQIKKLLREKGRPLPENDIWIAAIARQHGLTVISRDQRFNEIENLPVETW